MEKSKPVKSIKINSPEARLIGSIVFGDPRLSSRLEQSVYERLPNFCTKVLRCGLDGDIPNIKRRMMQAGLTTDESDQLLDTAEQALNAAYMAGPQRWAECGGVSQHMPPSEVFEIAHQAILQQRPIRQEI